MSYGEMKKRSAFMQFIQEYRWGISGFFAVSIIIALIFFDGSVFHEKCRCDKHGKPNFLVRKVANDHVLYVGDRRVLVTPEGEYFSMQTGEQLEGGYAEDVQKCIILNNMMVKGQISTYKQLK